MRDRRDLQAVSQDLRSRTQSDVDIGRGPTYCVSQTAPNNFGVEAKRVSHLNEAAVSYSRASATLN